MWICLQNTWRCRRGRSPRPCTLYSESTIKRWREKLVLTSRSEEAALILRLVFTGVRPRDEAEEGDFSGATAGDRCFAKAMAEGQGQGASARHAVGGRLATNAMTNNCSQHGTCARKAMIWGEPWVNGLGWARLDSHGRGCSIWGLCILPLAGEWLRLQDGGVELGPGRRLVVSSFSFGTRPSKMPLFSDHVSKCMKTLTSVLGPAHPRAAGEKAACQ